MNAFDKMKNIKDKTDQYANVIDACMYLAKQQQSPTDSYEQQINKLQNEYGATTHWKLLSDKAKETGVTGLIQKGSVEAGKCIIGNYMDSNTKDITIDTFFKEDTEMSVYEYLRNATGDSSITKENICQEKEDMERQ